MAGYSLSVMGTEAYWIFIVGFQSDKAIIYISTAVIIFIIRLARTQILLVS